MIYGYARVSTKGQERNGNSLEYQEQLLKQNGCDIIFKEAFTGTKKSRPQFDLLLERLQEGDMLVVTKMDRFARSVINGSDIINKLLDKGIKINILNMGVIDNSPASKLMRTMLLAFAEFERDMIVERTSEGKEEARKNNPNYREGRKEVDKSKVEAVNSLIEKGVSILKACKEVGIARNTYYKYRADEPLTIC